MTNYYWTKTNANFSQADDWDSPVGGQLASQAPTERDQAFIGGTGGGIGTGTATANRDVSTSDGGSITVTQSSTLNVRGDLIDGDTGSGTVTISSSTLNVSGSLIIGESSGSTGTMTAGGNITTGDVTVGASGTGTLSIGGTFKSGALTIGRTGNGSSVSDSGSLMTSSITVGGQTATATGNPSNPWSYTGGTGKLTMTGTVSDTGNLTFKGGTINIFGSLEIGGQSGAASNSLQVDASSKLTGHGLIASSATGTAKVGSTSVPTYSLMVTDNGIIDASQGTLTIQGNVNASSGTLTIDSDSTLELGGSLNGTVDFDSSGTGTLILDNFDAFANGLENITGLEVGDKIVLNNTSFQNNNGLVGATIQTQEDGATDLQIQEASSPTGATTNYTIPITDPISNMAGSEFFDVAQNGNNTALTLTNGNPIAQAVKAQNNQGQPLVSITGAPLTGAGVKIGVISGITGGGENEGSQMADVIKAIAPGADIRVLTDGNFANDVLTLEQWGANIIVDDVDANYPAANVAVNQAFSRGITFITSAGNTRNPGPLQLGPVKIPYALAQQVSGVLGVQIQINVVLGHAQLPNIETVGAMNWLSAPQPSSSGQSAGYITPEQTEGYSLTGSGKPNIIAPDQGPLDLNYLGQFVGVGPTIGTSYAAPAVAAVAALMMQKNPSLEGTPKTVDAILNSTADSAGAIQNTSAGLLDAASALGAVQLPNAKWYQRDPSTPVVASASLSQPAGDAVSGTTVQLLITLGDGVTVTDGSPTLTLNSGTTMAVYDPNVSDPSSGLLVFDYTVSATDQAAALAVTGYNANGATIEDANGNSADFSGLFNAPSELTINSPLVVTSVDSSQTGDVQAGQTVTLTLTLNEAVALVTTGGAPTLTLNDGATATYDANASNLTAGKLVFDYSVASGDETPNLAVSQVNLPDSTTVQDASGNNADFSAAPSQNTGLQVGPAFVTNFTTSSQNGAVYAGQTVQLILTMSEGVTVGTINSPTLTLSDGETATYDSAASTPSSGILAFDYTPNGQYATNDLTISQFNLNGATITDSFGVAADFSNAIDESTDPSPLQVGPVFAEAFAPSQTGNAGTGTALFIGLQLSAPVTLNSTNGLPTLTLNDGATATYDASESSPSNGALVFDYTVGTGDHTPNLEVTQVNLNGATVRDGNGVNVAFTTSALNTPMGLTINSPFAASSIAVVQNGVAQTGNFQTGQTIELQMDMSEGGASFAGLTIEPTLTLNDGATAIYDANASNPSLGEYVFDYTIGASDYTTSLAVNTVNLNGATFQDASGNNAILSGASGPFTAGGSVQFPVSINQASVSSVSASVTPEIQPGQSLTLTLNMNEPVTVDTTNGSPTLSIQPAAVGAQDIATYDPVASDPSAGRLVFDYTMVAGVNDESFSNVSLADAYTTLYVTQINPNGATISNGAGDPANLTIPAHDTFGFPTGTVVGGGNLFGGESASAIEVDAGQTVTLKLTFQNLKAINVSGGAPTLTLNDGGLATYDAGASNPSEGLLAFDYTAGPNDQTPNLTATQLNLNGAVVTDIYGEPSVPDLGTGVKFNSVVNSQVVPLQVGPDYVISASTTGLPAADTGQRVLIVLDWSDALVVNTSDGSPTLTLSDGATATYDPSSGFNNLAHGDLAFLYTVGANDHTSDLAVTSLITNGATLQDVSGVSVDATITQQSLGVAVNAPAASRVTTSATSAALATGQMITLTLTMTEGVTVNTAGGLPSLTLNDGGTAVYDVNASNPATGALIFDYTAGTTDLTTNLAVTSVNLNGATIQDSGGNNAGFSEIINVGLDLTVNIPVVTSVAASLSGSVLVGQLIELTLTMNQGVTVNTSAGSPTLDLDDGAAATYDAAASNPAAGTIVFDYPPAIGDYTPDLTVIGLNLNGATIEGANNGVNAQLSGAAQDYLGLNISLTGQTSVAPLPVTVTVQAANGIDLRWATLYNEFANSPIGAGGTSTEYTCVDSGQFNGQSAPIKFVVTGTGFTYSGTFPNIQLTGGTITGVQEEDSSNDVLATFTGFSTSATAFEAAMASYVAGGASPNASALNAIFLALPYDATGGAGSDELQGGNLNDTFVGSTGNDTTNGGGGTNTVDYSSLTTPGLVAIVQGGGGTVNKGGGNGIDTLTGIANLIDTGTGRSNGDVFYVDSAETVTANSSNFNYLIELSAGVNLAYGTNLTGISEFVSNVGTNTVSFATDPNFAYLFGSTGNDTLTLGSGGGYMFGEGGTNVLTGGANATNLFVGGDGGSDTMNGGTGSAANYYFVDGNDTLNGAGAFNAMIELVGGVTVQLGSSQYQDVQEFVADGGTNAVTVANTDTNFSYLYGGTGNDTLSTGSGGGYLIGEGGTNVLTGGGGLNVFVADGASGVDTMNGGSGSNVYFIDNNSTVNGAGTFNTVVELQQNVSLTLGSALLGTDVQEVVLNGGTNTVDFSSATSSVYLYGGAGNDTLFGGTGNDFLYGGAGTNTFGFKAGWGMDTIMDWTSGTDDQIDLTALATHGVHAITDLTQTIVNGNDVITSSHTGTNSITLMGVGSALTASSFHFA